MTSTTRDQTGSRPLGRTARRLIAVELPDGYRGALPRRILDSSYDQIEHLSFRDLSPELIADRGADTVLAPLLTKTFDAVELAEYLATQAFEGMLIIASEVLPNAKLVQREIARSAPGLNVELFQLNQNAQDLREV
ncbi:hypothetical protein PM03_03785 [Thalassobacter stenotrophicus]|uniref:hypothetical protein n=1 Tax=Thalassobacter TaxID=266808 RepID=UPI00051D520F|nr:MULTISPECIES: hypothetical protein [Thalassobacter]KGK79811.1 hypothetical protein PM03_03785 [Thalassobacter stenotrophicus]KGL03131.1 hypothetical protein PM04_01465 [Thalassobacter sp. 16PALIMAR09]